MPPDFDELPVPLSEEEDKEVEIDTGSNIENLLKKTSQAEDQSEQNLSEDLEVSILEMGKCHNKSNIVLIFFLENS